MSRFGEKGRSISNEDMLQEVQNIASMTGAGTSKKQFIAGLKTLRKADLKDYGNQWNSAYGNTEGFTEGFTGSNAALASNLAYNTELAVSQGGSSGTVPAVNSKQVAKYMPMAYKEVTRLAGIHGEGSDEVVTGLVSYLKAKGRSMAEIKAILTILQEQ
jgi:hypothetical protein